jgi:hypothetical protein
MAAEFARDEGLLTAVRAGGHSFAGLLLIEILRAQSHILSLTRGSYLLNMRIISTVVTFGSVIRLALETVLQLAGSKVRTASTTHFVRLAPSQRTSS